MVESYHKYMKCQQVDVVYTYKVHSSMKQLVFMLLL